MLRYLLTSREMKLDTGRHMKIREETLIYRTSYACGPPGLDRPENWKQQDENCREKNEIHGK
jgi:hypothetical protein